MVPLNPFSTLDRQNFPDFSPIFTRSRTPVNTERNSSFRWSIDHISRLKPAQIDTDPATLVKTNGHSPEDDVEEQRAIDRFFSQKTILPSPWPVSQTKALPKRVTFSPLPPATAYIREDSLVESEMRDSKTADAGTQTVLTIPLNCDMESLLGSAFYQPEEENNRDFGNSSLRRKLFGKPEKQQFGRQSDYMDVSPHLSPVGTAVSTPAQNTPYSKGSLSSSTPLHPSHMYSSHVCSPAIIPVSTRPSSMGTGPLLPGGEGDTNPPAASSLLLHSPDEKLPEFSPIGSSDFCSMSSHPGQEGSRGEHSQGSSLVASCHTNPSVIRSSSTTPPFSVLSPIRGDASSLPTASPMAASYPGVPPQRSGYEASPMVGGGHRPRSSAKATSTPNTAVMKRQLAASPFASPVLKQPCMKRPDHEPEQEERDLEKDQVENSDSEELAQPLSLADLKTETYDFTSITATTCTSYFTQMGLDEDRENRQPFHSTASSSHLPFHPPAHSTMVNSQHVPTAIPSSLPPVRVMSYSQYPSLSCADSGVAASAEFNVTSLTSNSQMQSLQASREEHSKQECFPSVSPSDGSSSHAHSSGHSHPEAKGKDRKQSSPLLLKSQLHTHSVSKQPDLSTIEEGEPQTDGMQDQEMETAVPEPNADCSNAELQPPSEMDSGLAFSPEVELSKAETIAETQMDRVALPRDLAKYTPSPIKLKVHSQKYAALLEGHKATHNTISSLNSTPSRHSTTTALVPCTHFPHSQGKFTSKSIFQSTVLPSRLKLYPPLSLPLTFSLPGSALSYAPGTNPTSRGGGGGGIITSNNSTTPSRHSRLGSTHKLASLPSFAEEVLRKKQTFKSRLQFNSPIKSAPSFSPSTTHLHSPNCDGFTSSNSWNYLPGTRTPQGEATLNFPHPTTPLSSGITTFNHHVPSSLHVHVPGLETQLRNPFRDGNRTPGRSRQTSISWRRQASYV